jgi:hypothetical protein
VHFTLPFYIFVNEGSRQAKINFQWLLIYTELPPEIVCEGAGETAFYHALQQPYLLVRNIQ